MNMDSKIKEIDLKQLQTVTNDVFDFAIHVLQKDKIRLDKSLYWNIDTQVKYDPTVTAINENQMGLGDLFEDLKDIERTAKNKDYVSTMTFSYLAKIFQYLAETNEWFE